MSSDQTTMLAIIVVIVVSSLFLFWHAVRYCSTAFLFHSYSFIPLPTSLS
jgi:hypothetical protein